VLVLAMVDFISFFGFGGDFRYTGLMLLPGLLFWLWIFQWEIMF
jgi:hypothetical protein